MFQLTYFKFRLVKPSILTLKENTIKSQFIYLIIVDVSPIYEYINIDLILYERYSFVLGIYECI
jgi:hypothetical protein